MGISSFKSGFTKVTALPLATVTATTGSPTIDTTSRTGKTIYKFTGSGTITVGTSGTCEYMLLGAGANNGAGGYRYTTSGVLPAGTLTVTIGAGTTSTALGGDTQLGDIIAFGGGAYAGYYLNYATIAGGGSGAGTGNTTGPGVAKLSGYQGNNGGTGSGGGPPGFGGGGGAGGVGGSTASNSVGGNGGAGVANSITGTSTTYCAGGGGTVGSGTNGTPSGAGAANTGNGGGGGTNAGGSGFVVVVIG